MRSKVAIDDPARQSFEKWQQTIAAINLTHPNVFLTWNYLNQRWTYPPNFLTYEMPRFLYGDRLRCLADSQATDWRIAIGRF